MCLDSEIKDALIKIKRKSSLHVLCSFVIHCLRLRLTLFRC